VALHVQRERENAADESPVPLPAAGGPDSVLVAPAPKANTAAAAGASAAAASPAFAAPVDYRVRGVAAGAALPGQGAAEQRFAAPAQDFRRAIMAIPEGNSSIVSGSGGAISRGTEGASAPPPGD
jgi:hypothetical protein